MVEISVTVPVYNVEKYLPRCLNTILDQTFKLDYEIICVDDGSTDNSGKILDEYAKKYTKIKVIHQKNQGLSVARNTALEYVTGKYTMFVDSDDFIAQNALEGLYNYAESHNSDVVIFDFLRGTPEGKVLQQLHFNNIVKKYGDNTFNIDTADTFVYRFIPVATWSKIYKSDLVTNIKFVKNLCYEDVPHWAEVYAKAKRVNYLPVSYYYYSIYRVDGITENKGEKIFDTFRAFSLAEQILRNYGHFEKMKNIHYCHLSSNIVARLQKIFPEIRQKYIETIQNYNMDIDYEKFQKEDFFQFEHKNMKLIKFIKENDYKTVEQYLKQEKIW